MYANRKMIPIETIPEIWVRGPGEKGEWQRG
jgi:hypothetical protein